MVHMSLPKSLLPMKPSASIPRKRNQRRDERTDHVTCHSTGELDIASLDAPGSETHYAAHAEAHSDPQAKHTDAHVETHTDTHTETCTASPTEPIVKPEEVESAERATGEADTLTVPLSPPTEVTHTDTHTTTSSPQLEGTTVEELCKRYTTGQLQEACRAGAALPEEGGEAGARKAAARAASSRSSGPF